MNGRCDLQVVYLPHALLVAALVTLLATDEVRAADHTAFSAVVIRDFDAWDADDNGTLSADEIDRLVLDPSIKGDDAAAIASLKIVLRGGKYTLPPLTRKYFDEYDSAVADKKKPLPNWDLSFRSCKRRISYGAGPVWPDDGVSLDKMRQGPLGDCYFVSVVGAMVYRNAAQVESMVRSRPDHRLQVEFPTTRPVAVAPLTDAQLAISSTTAGDGTWLALVEQAFGRARASATGKADVAEATDVIARGGSTGASITTLTGHGRRSLTMPRDRDSREAAFLPILRRELTSAMKDRRLVTAGVAALPTTQPTIQPTPPPSTQPSASAVVPAEPATQPAFARIVPPGINTKHAYAILSFDAETDIVEIWNPHGQNFKPKGEPGLKNGYPTEKGRFKLPLREAYRFLTSITIETDGPPVPPTTRPATRPAAVPAPTAKKIAEFENEYRFLSNFWPATIEYEGITYPSAEHAYQASKSTDSEQRKRIAAIKDPGEAKTEGRKLKLRDNWDTLKFEVMEDVVRYKFTHHDDLKRKLLDTADAQLEEGNNWGDKIWGTVNGEGENRLGKILMKVRDELRAKSQPR